MPFSVVCLSLLPYAIFSRLHTFNRVKSIRNLNALKFRWPHGDLWLGALRRKFHFCMAIREKMMLVPEARGFWVLLLEIELVWDIKKALGPLPVPSVLPFLIQRLLLLCVPSVHCEGSEPEMIKLWGRWVCGRTWNHKQDSKAYEREEIGGRDQNVTEHTCLSYVKQLKFMVTPLHPWRVLPGDGKWLKELVLGHHRRVIFKSLKI